MTKLASVSLSNIRRFGSDVTVELSPGATVLLAPNGTGKTAFFEAIELALTGMVSRLGSDLAPIIRDAQTNAHVRLQFSSAECTATLKRGGRASTQGDLSSVFGSTDAADIPYLLRLTHLLDQRERDWFVQADAKAAGSHLSRLPIGRDGSVANAVLTGTRRSITESLNNASNNLNLLKNSFSEWNSFISARDASTADLERPLMPQSDIADGLRVIAESLSYTGSLQFSGANSLASSREALVEASTARIDYVQRRAGEVAAASALVKTYSSEIERISRLESDRMRAEQRCAEPRLLIEQLTSELTQRREQIDQLAKVRAALERSSQRAIDIAHAKEQLDGNTAKFSQAESQVQMLEDELAGILGRRQAVEQAVQTHEGLRARETAIVRAEAELSETHALIDRWQSLVTSLRDVQVHVGASQEKLEQLGKAYQDAVASHANRQRVAGDAKSNVSAIASTVDSMRKAISLVAANLDADRSDCPVCGVDHGADELRRRLQRSLTAIDPDLATAERELHDAVSKMKDAEAQVAHKKAELQSARGALAQYQLRASAITSDIDAIRSNSLIASDSISSARAALQGKIEQVRVTRDALKADVNKAPLQPSIGDVSLIKASFEQASQRLNESRRAAVEASSDLSRATQRFASLSEDRAPDKSIDQISSEIVNADQRRFEIEEDQIRLASRTEGERERLASAELQIVSIDRDLGEVRSRIASIRSTWTQLELPGEPSAEVGSAVEIQLNTERAVLERRRGQLADYGIEIGRWRATEQNRVAQNVIDTRRGDATESDFSQQLQQKIASELSRITDLSRLSTALDSLSAALSSEIGNIHDRVVAIVPRWQSLLKRIVRDQRFASTELDFYSHYKKQHASVMIPLHGSSVAAPAVASEAQMTDLQLTFLLSMALSHRWSAWKGLLLDDPTQHHDLVHASSVFDVLRDFVVEHDFQVVVATHDALQARFLMRKLQNDGVPCRLWTLVPTAEGVTAVSDGVRRRG